MNDQYRIKKLGPASSEDADLGPFTVDQLYRMRQRLELSHQDLYWSHRFNTWLPISHLMMEEMSETLDAMKRSIEKVQVLGSGAGDCTACLALDGFTFAITEEPPVIPPYPCTCNPWCRLVYIAVR